MEITKKRKRIKKLYEKVMIKAASQETLQQKSFAVREQR